jgi:hypothetical protein
MMRAGAEVDTIRIAAIETDRIEMRSARYDRSIMVMKMR